MEHKPGKHNLKWKIRYHGNPNYAFSDSDLSTRILNHGLQISLCPFITFVVVVVFINKYRKENNGSWRLSRLGYKRGKRKGWRRK